MEFMKYTQEVRNIIEYRFTNDVAIDFNPEKLAQIINHIDLNFQGDGVRLYYAMFGQIPNYQELPNTHCEIAIAKFASEFENEFTNILYGSTHAPIEGLLNYDVAYFFMKNNLLVSFNNQEKLATIFYRTLEPTAIINQIRQFLANYRKGI
jgi:hypothetical protein